MYTSPHRQPRWSRWTLTPQYPVSLETALYLIRSTLLRLNDADFSGNYSVLRDLASPAFQSANTDAHLAEVFRNLRRRRVDLSPVALEAPHLTAAPTLYGDGTLQLSGFFPTRPLQISFSLKFADVYGYWRLIAIAVGTPKAPLVKKPPTRGRAARKDSKGPTHHHSS